MKVLARLCNNSNNKYRFRVNWACDTFSPGSQHYYYLFFCVCMLWRLVDIILLCKRAEPHFALRV